MPNVFNTNDFGTYPELPNWWHWEFQAQSDPPDSVSEAEQVFPNGVWASSVLGYPIASY
jgi:hypothetical protein